MLNYVPQVGSVGASVGVLHSVRVSSSDKCESGTTGLGSDAALHGVAVTPLG